MHAATFNTNKLPFFEPRSCGQGCTHGNGRDALRAPVRLMQPGKRATRSFLTTGTPSKSARRVHQLMSRVACPRRQYALYVSAANFGFEFGPCIRVDSHSR